MLAEARSRIVRYTPAEAAAADDILLVDVRDAPLRRIPGSKHVRRSVLEWRAAALVDLGVDAGDLDGDFGAWAAAGLPVE